MIVLDTSGLLAAIDASQPSHVAARRVVEDGDEPLALSPFVLAELDYLVTTRVGDAAAIELLGQVAVGVYVLEPFTVRDVADVLRVIRRYPTLGIGLADASVVVLAERLRTDRVLTLDERHFRVLRTSSGRPFTILPADA